MLCDEESAAWAVTDRHSLWERVDVSHRKSDGFVLGQLLGSDLTRKLIDDRVGDVTFGDGESGISERMRWTTSSGVTCVAWVLRCSSHLPQFCQPCLQNRRKPEASGRSGVSCRWICRMGLRTYPVTGIATFDLMADQNFSEVTVDDIVARAGISRRTFFRLFSGKNQVISSDHTVYISEVRDYLMRPRRRAHPLAHCGGRGAGARQPDHRANRRRAAQPHHPV